MRQRPIANILEVTVPSVKTGPTKCCMFGVNLNGTASFDASDGITPCIPLSERGQLIKPLDVDRVRTRKKIAHVHLTSYAGYAEAAGDTASHTEHMGNKGCCSNLCCKLLPHSP